MKQSILSLIILFVTMNLSLGVSATQQQLISIEIFQKNAINSDEKYSEIVREEREECANNAKNDETLIATVERMQHNGVSLKLIASCVNLINYSCYKNNSFISPTRTSITTQHDLSIVGGESAWLLEQFLDCKFSPVTSSTTTETLVMIQKKAVICLNKICAQPLTEENPERKIDISKYSLSEKLSLAGNIDSSPAILDALSYDTNEDVCRKIVQNPNTPTITLKKLSNNQIFTLRNSPQVTDITTSSLAILAGSHPKFGPRRYFEGNYLFLRMKKKQHC
jgi:hypothetical protein